MLDDPYFGRLIFMRGGYSEGELVVPGVPEQVGLVVPASDKGPSEEQAAFCRRLFADLDALFARCRPVFEGGFEQWAEKPFPAERRADFSLVDIGVRGAPWDYSTVRGSVLLGVMSGGAVRDHREHTDNNHTDPLAASSM